MQRVLIWGNGEAALYVAEQLKKYPDQYEIIGLVDSYATEDFLHDLAVYTPEAIDTDITVDQVIISVTGKRGLYQIIEILLQKKVRDIFLLKYLAAQEKWPLLDSNGYIDTHLRKIRFSDQRPTFLYVEIPIVNHCNLNCKGCFVSCNENDVKEHIPVTEIINDLQQMKKHFYDIPWIRFYGGEPLLFKGIEQLLEKARKLFFDSEIDILTNGLLIPGLKDSVLQSIQDNNITVNISHYPPIDKMLHLIEKKLSGYDIPYILHNKSKFMKFFTLTENSAIEKIARSCFLSGCRHLTKGKLSKCSSFVAFEKLNKQFKTKYVIHENKDWFDIYNNDFNAWNVAKQLNKAIPLCRYCSLKREEYEWEPVKKAKLEDYVLSNVHEFL